MADKCAIARGKLAQKVSSLKTSSFAERAGTLVKVGYLGSFKTTERNLGGNISFGMMQYFGARPIAVGTDYIQALARSAATFGKMKPHEFRQIANNLNAGGLSAGAAGIRRGISDAVTLMRTGVDVSKVSGNLQTELPGLEKFDLGETTFKNKYLDGVTKGVFNFLEAQDKPFYGFAFQTSLYGRARLMAIREGLSGAELTPRINELLANPTEEMTMGAHHDAMYATFKNPSALSDMAASMRQGVKSRLAKAPPGRKLGLSAASVAMDITIPFTKVASAIVNAGVDYSPFGFAKAMIQAAADRDPLVQAQLQQQLAKATLGTGLSMLGYAMFKNGTLTGSAPLQKDDRAVWDVANKQENSILINGRWRSITWLGPLAIPVLLGANFAKFQDAGEEKTFTEEAAFGAGSIGKTITEQSYMVGIQRLIEGLTTDPSDPRATSKTASLIASMIPVPSIMGQIATAIDPTAREARTVTEKLEAKTPFLSKRLPARVTPFGDEIQKTPGGVRGAVESLLDFTNPKTDASTPLTRELERLQVGLSGVASSFSVKGQKVQRSPETIRELTKEIGPETRARLEQLITEPRYERADDETRGKMLRKAMMDVKRPAYKRERLSALEDRIKQRLEARAQR